MNEKFHSRHNTGKGWKIQSSPFIKASTPIRQFRVHLIEKLQKLKFQQTNIRSNPIFLLCQMEDDTPTNKLTPTAIEWCQSQGRPDITTVEDILNGPDGKIMASIQAGIDRANKNAISNASKVQR